jgi:hypothetical protein
MARDKTSAELAQDEQDAIGKAVEGETKRREPAAPAKPDKRNAIQIERDEQDRVEKAVHGITVVRP